MGIEAKTSRSAVVTKPTYQADKKYKKRDGTSGIRGQLYETKLISLIHFRVKFDDTLKDYLLATNVADIGTFDDVCFRAKVKIGKVYKPVAVFIQAKHRQGENALEQNHFSPSQSPAGHTPLPNGATTSSSSPSTSKTTSTTQAQLTLNSRKDLAKWFASYLCIRRMFQPNNTDELFKGKFEDIECLFIMYTTAKSDLNIKPFTNHIAPKLNNLIGTGDNGLQPLHKEEDIVFLCEIIMKEQFTELAKQIAKFLSDSKDDDAPILSMNDELLLLYHVILVQKVFNVSEIHNLHEHDEHRIASFCDDFFDNNEEFVILFRDTVYMEMLKRRRLEEEDVNCLLSQLFNKPLEVTILNRLIGTVIMYDDKKEQLEFISKSMPEESKRQLAKIRVPQSVVQEATEFAAKDLLKSRHLKVPAAFGNKDLTIRGKEEDNIEPTTFIESTLDNLKHKLVELLHATLTDKTVVIDDSVGKEFLLQVNAGLPGAIGNILVSHENSKYLKFANDSELDGELAKTLLGKVQSAIPNIHDYRFHIQVKTFPKLTFECDDDEDVETLKDQVTTLAKLLDKFLCEESDSVMSMKEYVVLRYHVIVAQKVIDVSEIQCRFEDDEHRLASFRQDFFENDDDFVTLFRKALYVEMLKTRRVNQNDIDNLLTMFFEKPFEITILSKLVGTVIAYSNGKFVFIIDNRSKDEKRQLEQVNVSQSTVDEAIAMAVKEILASCQFKVPAAFGNKDLTMKIKKSKTERRLDHLKSKILELISNCSNPDKVITLNESLGDGFLKLYGGIAGIVGNILVSEGNTKLMKFTDNWESLEGLSTRLFTKLQTIPNLYEYRFSAKVKKFPKLTFVRDEIDENIANDFLKKLVFFTNQANQRGVEDFLKDEIRDHQCADVNDVAVTADAIYLQYHDLIQKWWMLKEGTYLTKQSTHYEDALALILDKPLMTIISKMYMLKIKNISEYTFKDNAVNALRLKDQPATTIYVSESSMFTVAKMIQSLKNVDHFVFGLEHILDLQAKDYNAVCTELKKTDSNKTIIIVCNNSIHRNWHKRLENIVKVLKDKRTIIVANEILVETLKTYFSQAQNQVTDERCSLIQMSETSQKAILQNTKVMFQDVEVTLESIIDERSMAFIEGEVLNKIINNEIVVLGNSNTNANYENFKHLYIDRRFRQTGTLKTHVKTDNSNVLMTLNDLTNVALVIALPGMGKTTLLTHLSLRTKELYPKVWIITINLLINSEKFGNWQKNETKINYLESLKFLFEVARNDKQKKTKYTIELEEINGDVNIKSCTGDQWTVFELEMFLDYYNRKELIFLFDGFDEICPLYTDKVLTLLKVVRNYPRKHKMWITSRSYDNVVSTLEHEFGNSYEIQHFAPSEQGRYLRKFWKSKIVLRDLCKEQYNNLCTFMEFMVSHNTVTSKRAKAENHQILFMIVCFNFFKYLKNEINECPAFVVDTFNALFNHSMSVTYMEDFDTPLHLYLVAEYFQNQIKDVSFQPNRWNLDVNAFTIYDTFIETKLKKIRFEEKNKIDLSLADNMIIYENIKADFFDKHNKLGAYAIFYQDADKIFNYKQLKEIEDIIDKIQKGTEKTGLINNVANGIPTFIHMTFTEYFAVRYICDLLKTEREKTKQKSLWDFILNVVFFKCRENVRIVLGYKIRVEENLRAIVNENEGNIFDLLLKQAKGVFTYYEDDFSKYLYEKIKVSLSRAMEDDFTNFMPLLYDLKETLTEDYFKDVTRYSTSLAHGKFLHLVQKKKRAFYPDILAYRLNSLASKKVVRRRKYRPPEIKLELDKPN